MVRFLSRFRYIVWIAVIFSMIASVGAFLWGAVKSAKFMVTLVQTGGDYECRGRQFPGSDGCVSDRGRGAHLLVWACMNSSSASSICLIGCTSAIFTT